MNASKARAVVVLASLVVACGGGNKAPPPTGYVQFTNLTSYMIDEFYAKPSASPDWGSAQNQSGPIAPSGTFLITGVPPGSWDFSAVSVILGTPYYAYAYGQPVVADGTLGLAFDNTDFSGSLSVKNGNNTYSINSLYVKRSSQLDWGTNQLSSGLAPGNSTWLDDWHADYYDVMCVYPVGDPWVVTGAYIASFSVTLVTCY